MAVLIGRDPAFLDHAHLWLLLCMIELKPAFVDCTDSHFCKFSSAAWGPKNHGHPILIFAIIPWAQKCLLMILCPVDKQIFKVNFILRKCSEITKLFNLQIQFLFCRLVALCRSSLQRNSALPTYSFCTNYLTDLLHINLVSCKMFLQQFHFSNKLDFTSLWLPFSKCIYLPYDTIMTPLL